MNFKAPLQYRAFNEFFQDACRRRAMRKRGAVRCAIAAVAAFAWLPSSARAGASEPNTMRLGGSYALVPMSSADASECETRCALDPKCRAWTFVKPAANKKATCWLKDQPGEVKADACCVSGQISPTQADAAGDVPAPGVSPAGSAAEDEPTPSESGPLRKTALSNAEAVTQPPRVATVFEARGAVQVAWIETYHWNGGRGAPPGAITLISRDGQLFGPWRTIGISGQGGAPNAYWRANVGVTLPPGTYTVVDSDPSTWATNASAGLRGFVSIMHQGVVAFVEATPPRR